MGSSSSKASGSAPEVVFLPTNQVAVHWTRGDPRVHGLWVTFEDVMAQVRSQSCSFCESLCSRCLFSSPSRRPSGDGDTDDRRKPAPEGREILRGISGHVKPGQILAIMGESGGGKSTLLNFLAGFPTHALDVTGTVRFGGTVVSRAERKAICGFVQQHDVFLPYLTVKEQLHSQAILRLGGQMPMKRIDETVEDTLVAFGLKRVEAVRIGLPGQNGISGGERKRLALAVECLSRPAVLICDEPISGSDAYTATVIVDLLNKLAKSENKAVIMTVHQPSSILYHRFSKVLFMAKGRVAFFGKPRQAKAFFESEPLGYFCPERYNPADFYMNLLSTPLEGRVTFRHRYATAIKTSTPAEIDRICDEFATTDPRLSQPVHIYVEDDPGTTPPHRSIVRTFSHRQAPRHLQFWVLLARYGKCMMRQPQAFLIEILMGIAVAIFAGSVFANSTETQMFRKTDVFNINGVIWYFVILNGMLFVTRIINYSAEEFPHFLMEQAHGLYHIWIYFLAKTIFDLPIRIMFPLISSGSIYWAIGLNRNPFSRVFLFNAYLIAHTMANASYAYALGALFRNTKVAVYVAHILNILLYTVGGGVFVNRRTLPQVLSWVPNISWYFYTAEGLYANQWTGVRFLCYEGTHNGFNASTSFQVPNATGMARSSSWVMRAVSATPSPNDGGHYSSFFSDDPCPFPNGEAVLQALAMKADNRWANLGVVALFMLVLRIVAVCLLYMKVFLALR